MALSAYHQKYASKPDEEIARRAKAKEEELRRIFDTAPLRSSVTPIRVAIMGCGEKRFIQHHRDIFQTLLARPVEITTFDLVTEHLAGETRVFQHDVTQPLPDAPYDVTYAHVLLKFIPTDKQLDVLLNSYTALREGGVAIHVFDTEELSATSTTLPDELYAVPLERWKKELDERGIKHAEVAWEIEGVLPMPLEGSALMLLKE
ncbi:MAG: hypothetical protein WC866_03775 [Patescibacteria group bacterium]|jgi:hypothetical protein